MRVDKREFVGEYSLPLYPSQGTRKLRESCSELASMRMHESFPNYHVLLKREQESCTSSFGI